MLQGARSWFSGESAAQSGRRLRVSAAHDEWNHVGIALVAMDRGLFAEEGLDDVEVIAYPEDEASLVEREALQVEFLARGIVDIAIDPRTTFVLEANDAGKPVCIVAARRRDHTFVLVGQKGLRSIEDLRGRTVDMGQPGGAPDVMFRQVLKDTGLEADRDVFISYTGGAMHNSTVTRRLFVDGKRGPACLTNTTALQSLLDQGFPILADLRTMYPSRHDRITAANEDFVTQEPDMLKGFLKGVIRASRWVLDPASAIEFREIMVRAGFLTTAAEVGAYDDLLATWYDRLSDDLSLPMEGIEQIASEVKRNGTVSPSFDLATALRLDALKLAQLELTERL